MPRALDDSKAVAHIEVLRVRGAEMRVAADRAAVEEPLEIRLHGRSFAVIMRTPGADRELAAGFLLSERVIRCADDLGTIEHCRDPERVALQIDVSDVARPFQGREIRENVVNVTLADASRVDALLADGRRVTTNSSCGLCGRQTIESLASDATPLAATWTLAGDAVVPLVDRLRTSQTVFDETGGFHAAGLFSRSGELVDAAEDVGRHNAVDKVIGRMLFREALPLSDHVLVVSGRASFEIVQKALFAGIALVASVSAPSSLAIDLANEMGMTLAGFVRDDGFNVYTHADRIQTLPRLK